MPRQILPIQIKRWRGSHHPSVDRVVDVIRGEGLRPYVKENAPNHRVAVRSHNYAMVLFILDGSMEITLPDSNQIAPLQPGDRVDIPAGVRYGTIVGKYGAKSVEAAVRPLRSMVNSKNS